MGDCIQEREGEGTYGEGHPSPREGTYGEGPPRLGFRVSCMRIQEREGTYGEGPPAPVTDAVFLVQPRVVQVQGDSLL